MKLNIEINITSSLWYKNFENIDILINKVSDFSLKQISFSKFAKDVELSILLSCDEYIKKLNKKFRGKNKKTNVLSFPSEKLDIGQYSNIANNFILGDIVFAFETIQKESEEQNKKIEDHFCHLLVHGILHLTGYDHIEDCEAQIMEQLEVNILEKLGIDNPY